MKIWPRIGWCAALFPLLLVACGSPLPPNIDSHGSTIVCLGDSITAGVGRGTAPAFPADLSRLLKIPVVNAGVPGDTAEQGLARLDSVLARDPWLVIIELGGNDLLRHVPAKSTEEALRRIVSRVLAAHAVPLLIEIRSPLGAHRYAAMFKRIAAAYDAPLIADALPDLERQLRFKSDAVHLNGKGYEKLAEVVAKRVRPWLAHREDR